MVSDTTLTGELVESRKEDFTADRAGQSEYPNPGFSFKNTMYMKERSKCSGVYSVGPKHRTSCLVW